MSNKWCREKSGDGPLRVYLLVSRNKDNKDVPGFKERRMAFIERDGSEIPHRNFREFLARGVNGEMCRMYCSVNARDAGMVKKSLIADLIFNEIRLEHIDGKIASIAARKECAAEKKWLFDFDSVDKDELDAFLAELHKYTENEEVHHTPNGYAIIVQRGFDTRKLMEKFGDIATLKRDDMLCIDWDRNDW